MLSRGLAVRAKVACGVVAGPLFVCAFTAIGAKRAGYDWRRHAVSSLADGPEGWAQRANFMVAGGLYCAAGRGLAQSSSQQVGPRAVPALIFGAGLGLVGSGSFVTDPVAGFPPAVHAPDEVGGESTGRVVSRGGQLHNLSAIPIFAGIPAAALIDSVSAARRRDYVWALYSAGSAVGMAGAFGLFGAAFAGKPRLARHGGAFQRISIATGFGWLTALSVRRLGPGRLA